MLRWSVILLVLAVLFEFGRTQIYEFGDFELVNVLVDGVDQSCVVQRKLTSGLLQSEPMSCQLASSQAARDTGMLGLQVGYVQVMHFSYRSPVDQRMYTGVHRTKPSPVPAAIGRSLEIRVSKKVPGRYKVAGF
jgi:hypothetical protein